MWIEVFTPCLAFSCDLRQDTESLYTSAPHLQDGDNNDLFYGYYKENYIQGYTTLMGAM